MIEQIHEADVRTQIYGVESTDQAEYLQLQISYAQIVREFPELVAETAKARSIAEQLANFGRMVSHDYPVLDYATAKDFGRLKRWLDMVDTKTPIMVMPYYEGATIEIVYVGGILHKAVTKGGGLGGKDITATVYSIECVPQQIAELERVSIRGIVTLPENTYDGDLTMAVSQALNHLNPEDPTLKQHQANWIFVPTEVQIPGETLNSIDLRSILLQWGFCITDIKQFPGNRKETGYLEELTDGFYNDLADDPFQVKGLLFTVVDTQRRLELGYTSNYPEWAIVYERATNGQ